MRRFLKFLEQNKTVKLEAPLAVKDVIRTQKELMRDGYPYIPEGYLKFLQIYNGVKGQDSALLGINPQRTELDLLEFNRTSNDTNDQVILGYDEFCYLVYNSSSQQYQIVDNDIASVVEEFATDELEYALNVILNVDD